MSGKNKSDKPNLREPVVALDKETATVETRNMIEEIKLDGRAATENPIRR